MKRKKSWRDVAAERLDRLCNPHAEIKSYGGIDRSPSPFWKTRYPWKSYNPVTGVWSEHHDADSFPGLLENPLEEREASTDAQDEHPTRPTATDNEPPKA